MGTSSRVPQTRTISGDELSADDAGRRPLGGVRVGGRLLVLLQRVPRPAVGALAHPLGVHTPAVAAEKLDSRFGHVRTMFVSERESVGEHKFGEKQKRERPRAGRGIVRAFKVGDEWA